jgi:Ca-activated chloride channel family protein
MRKSLWALLICWAVLPSGAQDASSTIRVNVKLVNVFVNVTDANGAIVGDLAREDFLLSEDHVPQKIAVFERQSEMPLSILLAIDTSGSVHKDLAIEQKAAHRFAHALIRPVDQMGLFEFSSEVREVVPFTNQVNRIDHGLDNLRMGPATALYDAVYLSSQSLEGKQGRKVLVLISDGGNTVKGVDYAKALEQALRAEVMVYSIIDVPIQASAGRDLAGEHAMITLSEETGGKYYYAEGMDVESAFDKISADLRTQYLLGYYPTRRLSDASFRRIEVKLKSPGSSAFSVRHRTGYYASNP